MYRIKFLDERTMDMFEISDDFMNHVYKNNKMIGPFRSVFPTSKLKFDKGYVVRKDGTIMCSLDCSSWIAQFDGCLESDIEYFSEPSWHYTHPDFSKTI
jgi:hypothetical protein